MLKKTFKFLICISVAFLFTGCSFGFFVDKTQEVNIVKDPKAILLIDKKLPEIKDNKYILECDGSPKQITIKRDGYKTKNVVCVPNKLSPAAYGTAILNTAISGIALYSFIKGQETEAPAGLFAALGGFIGGAWGLGLNSITPQVARFENTIILNKDSLFKVPTRTNQMKEIMLNNVGIDIKPENSEEYRATYEQYKNGKSVKKTQTKEDDAIKINETSFSEELNSLLKKSGFIDTSRLVLKSSYNQNAFLNATIIGDKVTDVNNSSMLNNYSPSWDFINVELNIKWDVLDYYKNVIYSDTIRSKSGEYVHSYVVLAVQGSSKVSKTNMWENAITDAIETGLYTLMQTQKFKDFIKLEKAVVQDTLQSMSISKAPAFVKSIEQAVEASVTIKTKNGHGSGFFISDNGYIVTNYHVIADSAKLEVVLNDGSSLSAKIIRVNKDADLALLKVNKTAIIPFKIPESDNSVIGKEIYAIGTPSAEDLSQTLTKGIVSSFRKTGLTKLIQTDASVSGGNSGGPMIDKDGNLVGIVNSKLVGVGIEGISFAIPAAEISTTLSIQFK